MRLGVASSLAHSSPEEWGEKMRSLGCGAVVFPVDYTAADDIIHRYENAAEQNDLIIAEVGVWRNPIAPDVKVRLNSLEFCKGQLALADAIGANCCVNIAGSVGDIWDGAYKENFSGDTWKKTVESIQEIIDHVNPSCTYYTIEPMPWMFPSDPDEYLRLLKDVDREHFAVHMDLCNWITSPRKYFFSGEFAEECFAAIGKYVKSCHLKDVALGGEFTFRLNETYCGGGSIDLEKYVLEALKINPDMPIIIEHLHGDDEYLESLEYVKRRFARLVKN
ncbi:MAG: sugar phosphate isomerase/epimerase [Clostridiales bacterium]|jgi:sugar phosphate isomerase/epimerase|nr:sugar phosphate isomerase/epimerase [Clostridiales bacterium]